MSIKINICQTIEDVVALADDLKSIKVSDNVLDVNMNQFAYSSAAPVHSSGYATCIGILAAAPGKGCLAHVDMTLPAFAGYKSDKWAKVNTQIYIATIARMVEVIGAAADVVLFASHYSRSGDDKRVDLIEGVVEWALGEVTKGTLTGIWDFRTHPGRPRTDKLGTVVEKTLEHYDRAIYFPSSGTVHLVQNAGGGDKNTPNTWARINLAVDTVLSKTKCEAMSAFDSGQFGSKNLRAMQVKAGMNSKMVSAEE